MIWLVVTDNSKPSVQLSVQDSGSFPEQWLVIAPIEMIFSFYILVSNFHLLFICSHPGENFFPKNLLVNVSLNLFARVW